MPEPTPFDDGQLYDRILGEFDYGNEFYLTLAKEARGPVLDVACGTGRLLLPFLEAGIDIEGVDLYQPMLDRLREKAAGKNLTPRLHRADMCDFRLDRKFAFIMIPFNAFIHNMTAADQIRCLTRCHEHLLPGGMLAFDTFFPNAEIIRVPAGTRVFEGEMVDPITGEPLRMYDTRTFDLVQQTQHSFIEIERVDSAGAIQEVWKSETTTRWIYKNEMQLLLQLAEFPRWEIYGDFTRRPLERQMDLMIVCARNDIR